MERKGQRSSDMPQIVFLILQYKNVCLNRLLSKAIGDPFLLLFYMSVWSSRSIYLFSALGFSSNAANAISFPNSNTLLPSWKEEFDASRVLERSLLRFFPTGTSIRVTMPLLGISSILLHLHKALLLRIPCKDVRLSPLWQFKNQ